MPINLKSADFGTRESRLGSITGYSGNLQDLVGQSRCGSLKNCDRCFSQSSQCASSCAVSHMLAIRDVAVVYHSSAGCSCISAYTDVLNRQLALRIGADYESVQVATDMNENDTIFGAIDRLRETILHTYETYHPKAIFVTSSCVSGIIGEDIDGLVDELSDELPIPLMSAHCEGFKSRIWASGFDIVDHAVLQGIVKPPKEKRNTIVFKNFFESHRPQITELFGRFGYRPQFIYSNSTVEELEHLSEASATVAICGTLGNYMGNALEELYGVPYIRTINPMGVTGFETWLRGIAEALGFSEEAERYIAEQRAEYLPKIEKEKQGLEGKRAVIGMGPGYTYEIARVLQELGMVVEHAAAWHFDFKYENGEVPPAMDYLLETSPNNIELSIADQQNYEIMNILNTVKPDVYFSRHPGTTVWAMKQGFSAVYVADEYMAFGYEGTLRLIRAIKDALTNRSFETNLFAHTTLPYTDWWYQQNSDAFLNRRA